jgi:nucleoside-diphosphate-sugar epimerase
VDDGQNHDGASNRFKIGGEEMRVFLAGATGAIGKRLVPLLVQAGHSVTGMTRSTEKAAGLRNDGADAAILDALDGAAVAAAVDQARPEVIIHELTALPAALDIRKFPEQFRLTNRLRMEGTDHLLAAARATRVRRFVAQSFAGWPYARTGGIVKTEDDPLDGNPPATLRDTLEAIKYLESAVLRVQEIEGIVLRYGGFYGPGNAIGENGTVVEQVRHRRVPIIGGGTGVWSFLHIDDAAQATLAAVERAASGIYNIVDDEPATVSEWLPALAQILGAKPPFRLPAWLGRLAIGEHGVILMTDIRGASNAKAKRELGWQPRWPSWRDGFRVGLSEAGSAARAPDR